MTAEGPLHCRVSGGWDGSRSGMLSLSLESPLLPRALPAAEPVRRASALLPSCIQTILSPPRKHMKCRGCECCGQHPLARALQRELPAAPARPDVFAKCRHGFLPLICTQSPPGMLL